MRLNDAVLEGKKLFNHRENFFGFEEIPKLNVRKESFEIKISSKTMSPPFFSMREKPQTFIFSE